MIITNVVRVIICHVKVVNMYESYYESWNSISLEMPWLSSSNHGPDYLTQP